MKHASLEQKDLTCKCGGVPQVPESGKIYAFNEGNYGGWEKGLQDYMMSLKDADKHGGKPYSARYTTLDHCSAPLLTIHMWRKPVALVTSNAVAVVAAAMPTCQFVAK